MITAITFGFSIIGIIITVVLGVLLIGDSMNYKKYKIKMDKFNKKLEEFIECQK